MATERRRYVIAGRVQGVGFRAFVLREARALGLTGWVRNRDDGHVELEAHGLTEVLDGFEGVLRRGPAQSRVDSISARSAVAQDEDDGFEVVG